MRRPALYRTTPTSGWAHPYSGPLAHAVFYNDGDPTPPVPPAPAAGPPKPGPPADPARFTQEDLDRIAVREKAQGKRSAVADFAKEQGFNTAEDAAAFIAAARKAKEDQLTEEQKRQKDLDDREKALESERATLAAERAEARREKALARLGATGDDLDDAAVILERDLRAAGDNVDDATLTAAAEALKTRRPMLFGATAPAAPGTPPPAPGGAPAGGPPPRTSAGGKPGDRGREMARLRGHVKTDKADA
jgi:hypothetical protein